MKRTRYIVIAGGLVIVSLWFSVCLREENVQAQTTPPAKTKTPTTQPAKANTPFTLQMAVVFDAEEPTFQFTIKNTSKSPITIPDFSEPGNEMWVATPQGRKLSHVALHENLKTITLAADEVKSWEFPVGSYIECAGTYRITWKVKQWETPEIIMVRKKDPLPHPPVKPEPVTPA